MKLTFSTHVTVERKDRFDVIMRYLENDIGRPLVTQKAPQLKRAYAVADCYQTLTDKGVILFWNERTQLITTIYLARMNQACAIYWKNKGTKMPQEVFNQVKRNQIIIEKEHLDEWKNV